MHIRLNDDQAPVKAKRKMAGWDNDDLLKPLLGFSKP